MRKKYIIDCDGGTDDAVALVMFIAEHKLKKINIEAVTCVAGNTNINNVVQNVFRTLEACGALDIPVFKGACSALLDTASAKYVAKETYHGNDGFGDVFSEPPDISKLNKEHAVNALNRIVSEDPGNVSVVCLGPLTNIALAIKMYPDFVDQAKEFFVMGGNSTAEGNVVTKTEFNFHVDPESVHIVLNHNKKPLWLFPWETCLKSKISHDWRRNVLAKINSPCIKLLNEIEEGAHIPRKFPYYKPCDAFLAGVVLKFDIVKVVDMHNVNIELHNDKTRGQIILNRLSHCPHNINIIEEIDIDAFQEVLLSCCKAMQT